MPDKILDFVKRVILENEPKAKDISVEKLGEEPHKYSVTTKLVANYKVGRKSVELPMDMWVDDINTLMIECKYGRFTTDI